MEITLNLNAVLAVNQFAIPEKNVKCEMNGITFAPGENGSVIIGATNPRSAFRAICQNLSLKKETFNPFSLNLQSFLKGIKPNKKNPLWISITPNDDRTALVEIEGEDQVCLKTDIDFMQSVDRAFKEANTKHEGQTRNHQNQIYFDDYLKKFFLDKFFVGGTPLFTRIGNHGLVTYPNFPVQDNGVEFFGVCTHSYLLED